MLAAIRPLVLIMVFCGASVFTACTVENADNPVAPTDNLSEKIIGKWMLAEKNGTAAPTNLKAVFTFESATLAYGSISISNKGKHAAIWKERNTFDVSINGSLVTLTEKGNSEGVTATEEFDIASISPLDFTAHRKISVFENGEKKVGINEDVRFVKITADYSDDILGTWEGHVTSDQDEYSDGKEHRWEYKADGTYTYYDKVGDKWVASANTLNEYFIDGTLLCSRWIDSGTEYREWWEIEIENGEMKWSALRQKADGTSYTATFEMKKVASPAPANEVDLAALTADYTAQDGDILTGKLANAVKITVADGASITLKEAYINDEGWVYNNGLDFAGITCLGDATITLNDSNSICAFHMRYPALFVPDGHTLTFQGDGILSARSNGGYYDILSGAIGSVSAGDKCGNLVFLSGKIYATGGDRSAAIGASRASDCGDITIKGTAEINVSSEKSAAAIGSGSGSFELSTCGNITIEGMAKVNVTGGSNSAAIGAGVLGRCGNITIGEMAEVTANGINCGPGIGAGDFGTCKAITISGGIVKATCDDYGPGIGSFYEKSKCESITITGGTIIATGGLDSPAIGAGPENPNVVPVIITSGITSLTAIRGSELADYIGIGFMGTRSVIIDGVEDATPESTFPNLESVVEGDSWTLTPKLTP